MFQTEREVAIAEENGWGERSFQRLCMMDGLVRKRGGGERGFKRKMTQTPSVWGNAGQKTMCGSHNQKRVCCTTMHLKMTSSLTLVTAHCSNKFFHTPGNYEAENSPVTMQTFQDASVALVVGINLLTGVNFRAFKTWSSHTPHNADRQKWKPLLDTHLLALAPSGPAKAIMALKEIVSAPDRQTNS